MQEEEPPRASRHRRDEEGSLSELDWSERPLADVKRQEARETSAGPEAGLSGQIDPTEAEQATREPEPSESGEGGSQRTAAPKGPEDRLLKNRRAQRRFRERQKSKIAELEGKNGELATELKRLQLENSNLDARMTALVRHVHQRNAQLEQLRSGQTLGYLEDEVSTAFTDDLILSWSKGQTFVLTPDQVRQLSREDLTKIWKEYVQQLATSLGEFDSSHPNTQTAALEDIRRLTHELMMILLRVSICSPLVAKNFAACRMEEPNIPEEDQEATWRSMVSTLMLSGEQRAELVQLRQLFLSKMHTISDQRREVLNSLYETLQVSPSAAGERTSAVQYIKAHEATNMLRQSLREDHALKLDFLSSVLKHLISPLQLARCLVQSYPWYPDTLALTSWLAADAGDPHAIAFFRPAGLAPLGIGLPTATFQLSASSRGGSGFSTPRHTTPPTPPRTTAAPTPFQIGQPLSPSGASWGMGSHQLLTQPSAHSGVSGMQYGMPSPIYTPHSPSPVPSPPLSPAHALMPGMPNPQQPPQQNP